MDMLDTTISTLLTTPFCPTCATTYDPDCYDFGEERACCGTCGTFYRVANEHVPDIPDDDLDIDPGCGDEDHALVSFRANADRIAERTARHTSGASYELYARRFSEICAPLIAALAPDLREPATAIARVHGYVEDEEYRDNVFGPGSCFLTGIEEQCCSCGRHP